MSVSRASSSRVSFHSHRNRRRQIIMMTESPKVKPDEVDTKANTNVHNLNAGVDTEVVPSPARKKRQGKKPKARPSLGARVSAGITALLSFFRDEEAAKERAAERTRGGGHLTLGDIRVPLFLFGLITAIIIVMAVIEATR